MFDRIGYGGLIALCACMSLAGCGEQRQRDTAQSVEDEGDRALSVYTVNYPLQYFAQRIGGELVQVEFPAPADVDPAYWSPEPELVSAYQGADLILLNGASYAGWVERMTLPPSKLVNTSMSFAERHITVESGVTHSHGPEGDHSHGEVAFTTWLDPTLAVGQAEAILQAFIAAYPEGGDTFQEGFDSLASDLQALDQQLDAVFARMAGQPLLGSHPVYQYLARRYGLDLESVHFEPDENPSENAWWDLQRLLAEHPAEWMLWEGEPLPETSSTLGELSVRSVVFDPCGNAPEEGDYLMTMRENVSNLVEAFGG